LGSLWVVWLFFLGFWIFSIGFVGCCGLAFGVSSEYFLCT
jgi:hypothetical protein